MTGNMQKDSLIILGSSLALLLIPLVAMQFTEEVRWTLLDFILAFALFVLLGYSIRLAIRRNKSRSKRLIWLVGIIVVFLIIWAELAVGIFHYVL